MWHASRMALAPCRGIRRDHVEVAAEARMSELLWVLGELVSICRRPLHTGRGWMSRCNLGVIGHNSGGPFGTGSSDVRTDVVGGETWTYCCGVGAEALIRLRGSSPRCAAALVACARLVAPSLPSRLETCTSTVRGLKYSRLAISRFDWPNIRARRTSCSRGVIPSLAAPLTGAVSFSEVGGVRVIRLRRARSATCC